MAIKLESLFGARASDGQSYEPLSKADQDMINDVLPDLGQKSVSKSASQENVELINKLKVEEKRQERFTKNIAGLHKNMLVSDRDDTTSAAAKVRSKMNSAKRWDALTNGVQNSFIAIPRLSAKILSFFELSSLTGGWADKISRNDSQYYQRRVLADSITQGNRLSQSAQNSYDNIVKLAKTLREKFEQKQKELAENIVVLNEQLAKIDAVAAKKEHDIKQQEIKQQEIKKCKQEKTTVENLLKQFDANIKEAKQVADKNRVLAKRINDVNSYQSLQARINTANTTGLRDSNTLAELAEENSVNAGQMKVKLSKNGWGYRGAAYLQANQGQRPPSYISYATMTKEKAEDGSVNWKINIDPEAEKVLRFLSLKERTKYYTDMVNRARSVGKKEWAMDGYTEGNLKRALAIMRIQRAQERADPNLEPADWSKYIKGAIEKGAISSAAFKELALLQAEASEAPAETFSDQLRKILGFSVKKASLNDMHEAAKQALYTDEITRLLEQQGQLDKELEKFNGNSILSSPLQDRVSNGSIDARGLANAAEQLKQGAKQVDQSIRLREQLLDAVEVLPDSPNSLEFLQGNFSCAEFATDMSVAKAAVYQQINNDLNGDSNSTVDSTLRTALTKLESAKNDLKAAQKQASSKPDFYTLQPSALIYGSYEKRVQAVIEQFDGRNHNGEISFDSTNDRNENITMLNIKIGERRAEVLGEEVFALVREPSAPPLPEGPGGSSDDGDTDDGSDDDSAAAPAIVKHR